MLLEVGGGFATGVFCGCGYLTDCCFCSAGCSSCFAGVGCFYLVSGFAKSSGCFSGRANCFGGWGPTLLLRLLAAVICCVNCWRCVDYCVLALLLSLRLPPAAPAPLEDSTDFCCCTICKCTDSDYNSTDSSSDCSTAAAASAAGWRGGLSGMDSYCSSKAYFLSVSCSWAI